MGAEQVERLGGPGHGAYATVVPRSYIQAIPQGTKMIGDRQGRRHRQEPGRSPNSKSRHEKSRRHDQATIPSPTRDLRAERRGRWPAPGTAHPPVTGDRSRSGETGHADHLTPPGSTEWPSEPCGRRLRNTGRLPGGGTPRFCIAAASATIRCRPARRLRPNIADRLVLACKSPTSKALTLATAVLPPSTVATTPLSRSNQTA